MKRILLTVEYDGTAYAGWQRQINGLAVQQVLEEALSSACCHPVVVTGASRTDAGVHALDQKVHFDTDCSIPPEKYPFVLNTMLPPDIRVMEGREVPADFHARFLTSGKTYTYRIWNARHGSAMRRNTHWHIPVGIYPFSWTRRVSAKRWKPCPENMILQHSRLPAAQQKPLSAPCVPWNWKSAGMSGS